MHPDREIGRMYRWSDGLSTRPDDLNTFTLQSSGTNNTARDLLHGPVTWNHYRFAYMLSLCLKSWHLYRSCDRHKHTVVLRAFPFSHQVPVASNIIIAGFFFDGRHFQLDLTHFVWLDSTDSFQLDLTHSFWLDLTQFLIWFNPHFKYIYSDHII